MKYKLLVVKFTQNHHADCPCLPILHHLHLLEQSDSIDGKFDGRLGRREHVLGSKVLEEEPQGLGHQESALKAVAFLHI